MENIALFVADNIDAMVAYWDKDQVCRFANKAYKEWFGKSKLEMEDNITLKDLLGDIYEMNLPYIEAVLSGTPQYFERELQLPSSLEKRNALASYIPDIADGVVKGFFVHVTDISKVKNLEFELKASELKFRAILETAPDAIIILNSKKEIEIINEQAEQKFGYKREELLGKHIDILIPERYRDELKDDRSVLYSTYFDKTVNIGLELFGLTKDGIEFPVEISFSAIDLPDGMYFSVAIRDVSSRKLAELELIKSNDRSKIFIQQAPNALAMFDMDLRYLAASEKWIKDYNLVGRDIIGKSHYDIFPEIGEEWKLIHQDCLKGAINQCDEAPFERADGTTQWLTWDVRPWYISEDKIGGLLMYTSDITHIKAENQARQRTEEILDKTNEVARIGTWEVDLVSNTVLWSRVTKEIHGVEPEYKPELSTAINFFKEGTSRQMILDAVSNAAETGVGYDLELELVTAKGSHSWVRAIGQAELKNGVCKRLYGVFQDIDEIKKSRESLNKANNELSTILNAGHVSIIGTNEKGIITHFSKGAELLLHYSAKEMVGINTPELIHLKQEVIERGEELSALFGKTIDGFDIFVAEALQKPFDSREWTYVRKDGSTFPVQLVITAIRNTEGEVTGFLGVATDISDVKKAEEAMKTLLDITTEQNKRLKNFAHIVSHNLMSHSGNIGMLLDLFIKKNPQESDNEIIKHIRVASDSLKETILNLNEVVLINNSIDQNLIPVSLSTAISSAINNVNQLAADSSVTISNQVNPSILVTCLPAYLDSILLNFITNGIKYRSPEREGKIMLSAEIRDKFVILTIEDNGLGINLDKNRDKLFGMYKTFHGNKDARGIGLFITKNQVESMGGKIEVESEVNKGTIFNVFFKYEKN